MIELEQIHYQKIMGYEFFVAYRTYLLELPDLQ